MWDSELPDLLHLVVFTQSRHHENVSWMDGGMMDVGMEETGNRERSWVLSEDLFTSYSFEKYLLNFALDECIALQNEYMK